MLALLYVILWVIVAAQNCTFGDLNLTRLTQTTIECEWGNYQMQYVACGAILCSPDIGRGMVIQNGDRGCIQYLAIYDNGQTQPTISYNAQGRKEYIFEYLNGYTGGVSCTAGNGILLTFVCDPIAIPYSKKNVQCGQPINDNNVCEFELTIPTHLACTG